jgi:hypothetical protein
VVSIREADLEGERPTGGVTFVQSIVMNPVD